MNRNWKITIVASLVIVVGAVVLAKLTTASKDGDSSTLRPRIAGVPTLLDLGATECIPCKMMAPVLDELAGDMAGKLNVEFIDVWKNPDAGTRYGISGIPTQIFYDASGKELSRHEGFIARQDIVNRFKEHGIELPVRQLPVD